MKMTAEQRIAAPRERVFEALNDPEILRRSIPGCESRTKSSDTGFDAIVTLKVGPVKAKFAGSVTLSDIRPPVGYSIAGEGRGGAAGFARGRADVTLVEDGEATILKYDAKADLGGRIAQLGGRLIDSTARKVAGEFFTEFARLVEQGDIARIETVPPAVPREAPARRITPAMIAAGLAAAAILLAILLYVL